MIMTILDKKKMAKNHFFGQKMQFKSRKKIQSKSSWSSSAEHPTQQGIRNLLENGTSNTTGDYWGSDQISGASERLSVEYCGQMDVQFIMIMTIF